MAGRRAAARHPCWPLAYAPDTLPLPATTAIGHLRENLGAQDLARALTAAELAAIDGLTLCKGTNSAVE
ncbi:MAG TPA: hypothetical protein VGX23_32370 [Actinocrinis sp.]|nr:hypothetical protein [Actinocrinis sp.]